jgi:hypothetical protein
MTIGLHVRDSTLKSARLYLEEELEAANAILKAAIEDAVESLECAFTLFEACEQDPKKPDRISVSMHVLERLKREQDDAEAAVATAFKDHAWELRQARRRFKEAIVREAAAP